MASDSIEVECGGGTETRQADLPAGHHPSNEVDEESLIVHSDRYYTQLLQSLENIDFVPTEYHFNVREEDSRSPFRMLWKAKQMRRPPKLYSFDDDKAVNKEQRELQRVQAICVRNAKSKSHAIDGKLLLRATRQGKPSSLEKNVERAILDPLRTDHRQYRLLQEKVAAWKEAQRSELVERARRPSSPEENLRRQVAAKERREKQFAEQELLLRPAESSPEDGSLSKSNHGKTSSSRSSPRVRQWLQIWAVLASSRNLGQKVHAIRAVRAENFRLWKAVRLLQRAWRKKHRPVDSLPSPNVIEKMKKLSAVADHAQTYNQRTAAASLITCFLRDTRYPACFRRLIRFVKRIQRAARSLRTISYCRVNLLSHFLESCLPSLAFNINIVTAGHGLDLRNLSSLENSMLKVHLSNPRLPRCARSMATPEFHAFLRLQMTRIVDFHRDFVANGKWWNDSATSRKFVLRRFLASKRKEFLDDLHRLDPMVFETQPVTIDDARMWIKWNEDVVADRLAVISKKIAAHFRERHKRKTPFRPKRRRSIILQFSFRDFSSLLTPTPTSTFKIPLLLLLSRISPKEVLELFWEIDDGYRGLRQVQHRASAQALMAGLTNRGTFMGIGNPKLLASSSRDEYGGGGGGGREAHGLPSRSLLAASNDSYDASHFRGGKPSSESVPSEQVVGSLSSTATRKPVPPSSQRRSSVSVRAGGRLWAGSGSSSAAD